MADALATAPAWVTDLRSGLLDAGFDLLVERRYGESFGNYSADFSRGSLVVTPNLDRGFWDIGVARRSATHSEDPWPTQATNVHLLRRAQTQTLDVSDAVPTDVAADARWLLTNVTTVAELVESASTWRALHDFDRLHAMERFNAQIPARPAE